MKIIAFIVVRFKMMTYENNLKENSLLEKKYGRNLKKCLQNQEFRTR